MKEVGIIGWRGMVGSVLIERMRAERDFEHVQPIFFSTSQVGAAAPDIGRPADPVQDANDSRALARLPMLISTQGGDYTEAVHARLRASGLGRLLDRCGLHLADGQDSVIVLDPVNLPVMKAAREQGHQGLHRRQLHRLAHAHGGGRPAACGAGGMDHGDDLSIGFGSGCAEHARAARSDGSAARFRRCAARRIHHPPSSTSTAR